MQLINKLEPDSSIMENAMCGIYYYYIPIEEISNKLYNNHLGFVPCIDSIFYNPFIVNNDIQVYQSFLDSERFGTPNGEKSFVNRIAQNQHFQHTLGTKNIFPSSYDSDYEPKLDMFPYNYFTINDFLNSPLTIKPQLVGLYNNGVLTVKAKTMTMSNNGKFIIYAENYKNDMVGNIEGIINNNPLLFPVASSTYSQFVATSSAQYEQNIKNTLMENDTTLKYNLMENDMLKTQNIYNTGIDSISNGIQALTKMSLTSTANFGKSAGSGTFNALSLELDKIKAKTNSAYTEHNIESMALAKKTDMLNTPRALKNVSNDTLFNLEMADNGVYLINYGIQENQKIRLKKYFKKYGYKINRYDTINFNRKYFDFIKTQNCNCFSNSVPREYMEEINDVFNNGVTFWHVDNGAEIKNYNVNNMEV